MRRILISILLATALGSCGDGQWGASVELAAGGTDAHGDTLAPGHTISLAAGAWSLTLDRACLALELASITPAAGEGETGSDCFCHGDPPECHGDCSTASEGAPSTDLLVELDAVVDLLDEPVPLSRRGAAPGDLEAVSLVLGGHHAEVVPAACVPAEGHTLFVQGTLTNTITSETWSLTVDIHAETVTEPIGVSPAATATTDTPASVLVRLRLDVALDHVDFAAVTADASGTVTIGGPKDDHPEAAEEILHGLSHAESYAASDPGAE